jgi:hypothetical protein
MKGQPAFTAYGQYSPNSGLSNNTEDRRIHWVLCRIEIISFITQGSGNCIRVSAQIG